MSATFNFKNIFPTCLDDYNNNISNSSREINSKRENECITITNILGFHNSKDTFMPNCKDIIIYLDYIDNNSSSFDINPSCKYFNYKLKKLLSSHKSNIQSTKVFYNNMINITNSRIYKNVPGICMNYFDELDDSTFTILDKLNNLYSILKRNGNECPTESECYEKFMELSNIYGRVNNESLREILSNFRKENIKIIENIENVVQVNSKKEVHAVSHHTSGINARTIILFTIHVITEKLYKISNTPINIYIKIFLNYQYTSYVSFLHPISSIIRIMWNRKNKTDIKLFDSFENNYEELIDKRSQISYNALQ
ncbi:variable surface protein [Plasmodium gonderi]|uniref:Variable surface protein n=1 Tax=Plasmodium gonderi TaxID=77519 RepID=A0A1Y1JUK7_PLAGO|nr:variable surface protein [Plasmodium gonderi]GAW84432.1 variable surface protein [Plasmodium gonderi]